MGNNRLILSVNTNLYNFVYISHKKLLGGLLGIEFTFPIVKGHPATDSPGGVLIRDF